MKQLSQHELQSVISAIDKVQAIIWFDTNGTILGANDIFCRVLGYRPDEIIGKHHRIFVDAGYSQSQEYRDFWRRLAGGETFADEYKRITKDGSEVFITASYNSIRGPDGQVEKIAKFAIDVTQQKRRQMRILNAVSDSTDSIASDVESITNTSNELSKRFENQAATVEETSAAMEEISATVNSNVQSAEQATSEARQAKEQAENGSQVVDNAIAAMAKIENGSKEIRKFIEVIDSIAFQTNLLALNAGVEAARAGDAGRGFAVVASEVRALAQRASESAKDINALIDTSTREVEEGARLVNETGEVLAQIKDGVSKVSDGIESIFSASREQATGVNEINQSITNIDKDTQRNATMSQQTAESAASLAQSAADLVDIVQRQGRSSGSASASRPPRQKTSLPNLRQQAASGPVVAPRAAPTPKVAVNAPAVSHDQDEDAWTEF